MIASSDRKSDFADRIGQMPEIDQHFQHDPSYFALFQICQSNAIPLLWADHVE